MSSILRIESSRANGAKSRGPVTAIGKAASAANAIHAHGAVTPEGKARASQNATRHGMLAQSIVLPSESDAGFTALLAELLDEFQPETPRRNPPHRNHGRCRLAPQPPLVSRNGPVHLRHPCPGACQ